MQLQGDPSLGPHFEYCWMLDLGLEPAQDEAPDSISWMIRNVYPFQFLLDPEISAKLEMRNRRVTLLMIGCWWTQAFESEEVQAVVGVLVLIKEEGKFMRIASLHLRLEQWKGFGRQSATVQIV